MTRDWQRSRQLVRTYRLIALLRSTGGCTLERLARELGVTSRTVRRDLEALHDAGIAVYDFKWDEDGIRRWRTVKGAPCAICGRATLKGAELRRDLQTTVRDVRNAQ